MPIIRAGVKNFGGEKELRSVAPPGRRQRLDEAEAEYKRPEQREAEAETEARCWKWHEAEAEASKAKTWLYEAKFEVEAGFVPNRDVS